MTHGRIAACWYSTATRADGKVDVMQTGDVIYQSEHISARYVACDSTHVVVSFPDRVHPLGINQPGWGETFLNKRGISAIYIALTETNWFQCPDFFEAMRACRGFLGPDVPVTAYGSSMGGYGALLAAKTLEASLCIALSPQISIDPEVVPFERRYLAFAKEIGPFLHDVSEQAGPGCHYVIAYDPLHGKDRKHVLRCSKHFQITELPVYCGSHGVLNLLKRAEAIDCLADLLVEKATPGDLCAVLFATNAGPLLDTSKKWDAARRSVGTKTYTITRKP